MRRTFLALAVTLLVIGPGSMAAQTTISARGADLTIGGRLHGQYQTSSAEDAINSFFIRRARIIADISFNDFFVGRLQTDFAGPGARIQDAYVRLDFSEAFRLTIGQKKRPFDIFEIASSTDLSIIERTGVIVGYSNCTGVGLLCSFSTLNARLRYSGRDAGLHVDGRSGAFYYQASLTNGNGIGDVTDENDGKSFGARAGYDVAAGVTVSANVAVNDYLDPADETAHGVAVGADVQVGTWREGLLVQAGLASGDNWRSLDALGDPGRFLAFQTVASYYYPRAGDRIIGIEPLFRISIGDPDDNLEDDGGVLYTPGVMFYLLGRNKIGVNLDYYVPGTGDAEYSFRFATLLYF